MGTEAEIKDVQAVISQILARVLGIPVEMVKPDMRFSDCFGADPDGLRAFVVRLEDALKMPIGDTAMDNCRTLADLSAYCVARRASNNGGRMYIVVCRMPNGNVCERHYRAKGHERAAQLALDNGAEEILSVEREDSEDHVRTRSGFLTKFLLPLIFGAMVAIGGVVAFWWKRGCPKVW